MKKFLYRLTLVLLTSAAGSAHCPSADTPAFASPPGSGQVGDYGLGSALMFEGNQTFSTGQIFYGIMSQLDYHVAAHPAAPLAGYLDWLNRSITLGYRHAGFPAATVKVDTVSNTHHVVVRLAEGERYHCGDILLSGASSMTNEVIRRKIADTLAGLETGVGAPSDLNSIVWVSDQPAPLDEFAQESLANLVRQALAALNYYEPKVSIFIVLDSSRKRADLKVEIADEGIKGIIDEIRVTGLVANTRPQLLDFLKLKTGTEVTADLISNTANKLRLSARYFRHEVSLAPLAAPGHFMLVLDLDEVREAPPLNNEFSPKERALLKFRDWLAGWEARPEDFVVSIGLTNSIIQESADLVLSQSGLALAIRDAATNGPTSLRYGFIASGELIGLYSVSRQANFVVPRINDSGGVRIRFRPPSPNSYGSGDIGIEIGANIIQARPFILEMDLQPAVFLSMSHWMDSTLGDGVLRLRQTVDDTWQEIRIEAATGRLLQFTASSNERNALVVRIRPEEGALAKLLREIAASAAGLPNRNVTNHGFGSWVSFMAADLVEPAFMERLIAFNSVAGVSENQAVDSNTFRPQTRAILALVREVIGQRNLNTVFDPLNRIPGFDQKQNDEESFVVPTRKSLAGSTSSPLAQVSVLLLKSIDNLAQSGTWPWVLIRESALTMAGHGEFMQTELDKLIASEDMGPVGCLSAAFLLGKFNPNRARSFAQRGLTRLHLDAFRQDYKLLLHTNSIIGALAGNVFSLPDGVDGAKLESLFADTASDESAFLGHVIQLLALAKGTGQSTGDAMWPAFEKHWEKVPRRYLENALNRFLPQVQFLTNSQALFVRGRMLLAQDSVLRDIVEAAQCFRKAAEMGHAEAQVCYGHLCESGEGVPRDMAEAIRWYRKAAEQNAPHSICSLAAAYQFGKGVPQDLQEATKLYRVEAEHDCPFSQFSLGRILEANNAIDDALKWYRRAAGEGAVPAQARLGDLLSDEFSTKPDYPEACQWLSLAAAAGDNVSAVLLRRVRANLSVEQLAEIEKRVALMTRHIEDKLNLEEKKMRAE